MRIRKNGCMFLIEARRIAIVILGSFLLAIFLIFFLITANVYASGFSGLAQLVSSILHDFLNIRLSTGVLLFIINVPVLILGWFNVGKGFTLYSALSVVFSTFILVFLIFISFFVDYMLYAVVHV